MNSSFRALIVDLSTRFGGASTRSVRLLAGMPRGMAAIATLEGSPVFHQAQDSGLEIHVVGRYKLDHHIPHNLSKVVQRGGFHLLDSQNPQSKFWASRTAKRHDMALVSTLNSWYLAEHQGRMKGRFYQRMEDLTSRRLDHFITVSNEIYNNVLARGYPADIVSLIVNAVQIDSAEVADERAKISEEYRIPPDAFILCAVGRLVRVKGYKFLLRALAEIRQRYPQVHCVLVGNGDAEPSLRNEVQQLQLEGCAHLIGFQNSNRVLQLVKAADAFVMPSLSEGTPVALLEAAALEKPIVASDVGGIPTVLTHQEQALLVPPGQSQLLADAISSLVADPQRARELGRSAGARIRSQHSLVKQVEDTLSAYTTALAHARVRLGTKRVFPQFDPSTAIARPSSAQFNE